IQKWTGASGKALFDSLVVFENVPIDADLDGKGSAMELVSFEALTRTHYPLTLTVFPSDTIDVQWDWNLLLFDASQVERVIEVYAFALSSLCADERSSVGDVAFPVEGDWQRPAVVRPFRDVI